MQVKLNNQIMSLLAISISTILYYLNGLDPMVVYLFVCACIYEWWKVPKNTNQYHYYYK